MTYNDFIPTAAQKKVDELLNTEEQSMGITVNYLRVKYR
jgi:hypothetical protein